jgi:hypothetical protein
MGITEGRNSACNERQKKARHPVFHPDSSTLIITATLLMHNLGGEVMSTSSHYGGARGTFCSE